MAVISRLICIQVSSLLSMWRDIIYSSLLQTIPPRLLQMEIIFQRPHLTANHCYVPRKPLFSSSSFFLFYFFLILFILLASLRLIYYIKENDDRSAYVTACQDMSR